MKVDAKTADTLGWFTAIVKRPFHAEWSNYGMPDLATDYKAGEKIRCVAWKPEGMSPCKAAGHPDMWLSWKLLDNCEYSAEDVARLERLTAENSRARNAKFKVGEYVTSKERPYLGKGRITDEVDFNQYIVKFGSGAQDLFEGSDLVAANACAKNGIRSTNAAVNAALNGCARNAAPPKTIDLSAGNWEATLMPRTDYLLLEKGDIRTKDYTALEGTVAEVTRKVYSSVKGVTGKDLADVKAIVAKANAEMVKYKKDERSHGRGTNSACARNAETVPAAKLAAQWNAEAKELEDMVRKVTPWRAEMKKMRARADAIGSGAWQKIDENDPDAAKADAAYQRLERARSAASDLWWSI